ncbi:MAG: hypothetical protein IT382_16815 [Deltaproteobacteria bacterium]|nr:hypothetical protein [Deltaproteobacteria bacterium]
MSAPGSAAAPGRNVGAESALQERVLRLRVLDGRLAAASRVLVGALLLAVLACACVLVALPDALTYNCTAMQVEAQQGLRSLYVMEQSYLAEFDRPALVASELGLAQAGLERGRYVYVVSATAPRAFALTALGTGPMAGDRWTLDERGQLQNPTNLCEF